MMQRPCRNHRTLWKEPELISQMAMNICVRKMNAPHAFRIVHLTIANYPTSASCSSKAVKPGIRDVAAIEIQMPLILASSRFTRSGLETMAKQTITANEKILRLSECRLTMFQIKALQGCILQIQSLREWNTRVTSG